MNFDIRIIGRRQEGGLHLIYHQTDKGYESFAQAVEKFAKKRNPPKRVVEKLRNDGVAIRDGTFGRRRRVHSCRMIYD